MKIPNTLYFDGGAKPNPGKGEYGFCLVNCDSIIMKKGNIGDYVTNNFAEYTGLLLGIQFALDNNIKELRIIGDSQLIINQITNKWKCNDLTLKQLNLISMSLLEQFDKIQIEWIDRNNNIAGILLEYGEEIARKKLGK